MQCILCFSETWNNTCPICEQRRHHKTLTENRHQRQRYIKRRGRIITEIWKTAPPLPVGQLSKYNLSCNCWLCKYEKKAKIIKPKYRTRVHPHRRGDFETHSDNITCD